MAELGRTDGAAAREMITFLIGTQEFCIDVMLVREIRVWSPATPVAHAPGFVCGVINLRGKVLPIIDFAARLGFPPTQPTTRHAILVVQIGDFDDQPGPHPADARRRLAGREELRQRHHRHRRPHDQPDRARRHIAAKRRASCGLSEWRQARECVRESFEGQNA
jgi:hypothetical protein